MQTNLMKLVSFTLAMFCLASLSAQQVETNTNPQKKRFEIGLTHEIGNGYSLLLRKQLKEKIFLRAKLKAFSAGIGRSLIGLENQKIFSADLEASIGLEFHIPLNERLSIYHGPEISGRFRQFEAGGLAYESSSIGVGYFAGVLYKVTKGFSIFAEVGNTISYGQTWLKSGNIHNRSNGFSNFEGNLTIGASINLNRKKKEKELKSKF